MSAIYGTLDRVVWGFSPAIFKRLKWLKQCDWLSIVASSTGLVFVDSVGFSTTHEVGKGGSGSFDDSVGSNWDGRKLRKRGNCGSCNRVG